MDSLLQGFVNCLKICCLEEDASSPKSSDDESPMAVEDATLPSPNSKPPTFDPEDYAFALREYGGTGSGSGGLQLRDKKGRVIMVKDKKATHISTTANTTTEMTTKKFSTLPEMLKNLKEDLSVAYLGFVKEFVREPHDGVWLLLDLLRTVQQTQAELHNSVSSREKQSALRRALLDEHTCLSCLRYCLRCADTAVKLSDYQQGLYVLSVATMSNMSKSRTLALQLLTRVCESSCSGHRQVLDAMSTLRLRFAETVRCKYLVSMLQTHPSPSFCVWCLRLLNALVGFSSNLRQRIHLQEELVEAGFNPATVKKIVEKNGVEGAAFSSIEVELERWSSSYVDVTQLGSQIQSLQTNNQSLSTELSGLREANMKLLEENVLLKTIGGEVQEQYLALQRRLEEHGLPSAPSPTPSIADSDFSLDSSVRRGTVLRRPSRSSSVRSFSLENDQTMTSSPDILPRSIIADHVTSDTFTYASGQIMSSVVNGDNHIVRNHKPEPLPRSTSLIPKVDEAITAQPTAREDSMLDTTVSPYMSPMDLKHDDPDSTINRYTPPVNNDNPQVHQKTSNVTKTLLNSKTEETGSDQQRRKSVKGTSSSSSSLDSSSSNASSNKKKNKEKYNNSQNEERENSDSNQTNDVLYQNNLNQQYQNTRDPDYQNISKAPHVSNGFDSIPSEEGDYEQDMVVYEAITVGNDMIELVSGSNSSNSNPTTAPRKVRKYKVNSSSSSSGSSSSTDTFVKSKNRINFEMNSKLGDCDVSNVKKSIKHYENLVLHGKDFTQSSDEEVALKSVGSTLSLESQDTVKENNFMRRNLEDRREPDGQTSEEVDIVPNRQRIIAINNSQSIKLFDVDSPTETSDTGTYSRSERCSSPRTIETESTRSFGFVKPDRNLHRRDTMAEKLADRALRDDVIKVKGVRRSESFQMGDSIDGSSPMKRLGSTDTLIDSGCGDSPDLCINGRAFTRYSSTEGSVEANELLKAALSRRQCRSVEDRLDQWLEEDLKRISHKQDSKAKFSRSVSSHVDDNRKTEKVVNRNKLNNKKYSKSKSPPKRFSNGDLLAFKGFVNPSQGFNDNEYGHNFMLNRPLMKRKTEFLGEKAEFGVHEFPVQKLQDLNRGDGTKWSEIDPDIPTPDYIVTPAGTLTPATVPQQVFHILDMPSGLY